MPQTILNFTTHSLKFCTSLYSLKVCLSDNIIRVYTTSLIYVVRARFRQKHKSLSKSGPLQLSTSSSPTTEIARNADVGATA